MRRFPVCTLLPLHLRPPVFPNRKRPSSLLAAIVTPANPTPFCHCPLVSEGNCKCTEVELIMADWEGTTAYKLVSETKFTDTDSCKSSNEDISELDLYDQQTQNNAPESSFTSIKSLSEEDCIALLQVPETREKNTAKLKDRSTSKWNHTAARLVYSAFNVRRFIVENNFIFNPTGQKEPLLLTSLLNERHEEKIMWPALKEKIDKVIHVFDGDDVAKIADGLHNQNIFHTASRNLRLKMMSCPPNSEDREVNLCIKEFHLRLHKFLNEITECQTEGRSIPETIFEAYFAALFRIFDRLGRAQITLEKSLFKKISFALPSMGETICPKPDFFITNDKGAVVAIIEVKPPHKQRYPSHKGHRQGSGIFCTTEDSTLLEEEGCDFEKLQGDLMTDMEDWDDEDNIEEQERLNDTFERVECQREALSNEPLQDYIRTMEYKEKKQVRCFLPQLIGQLLACCNQDSAHHFDLEPNERKRVGIGLVGVKLRIVTMVLRDKSGKILLPKPADIETCKSVRPYFYLTREMNLCKKNHLMMFFEMLCALNNFD